MGRDVEPVSHKNKRKGTVLPVPSRLGFGISSQCGERFWYYKKEEKQRERVKIYLRTAFPEWTSFQASDPGVSGEFKELLWLLIAMERDLATVVIKLLPLRLWSEINNKWP